MLSFCCITHCSTTLSLTSVLSSRIKLNQTQLNMPLKGIYPHGPKLLLSDVCQCRFQLRQKSLVSNSSSMAMIAYVYFTVYALSFVLGLLQTFHLVSLVPNLTVWISSFITSLWRRQQRTVGCPCPQTRQHIFLLWWSLSADPGLFTRD